MRYLWPIVIAMLGLSSASVLAQSDPGRDACKADVEKYCKDVEPGQGRMGKCLVSNEANLSESCKAAIERAREHAERMRQRADAITQACMEDMKKFCEGVQPGHGRIARCLKQNEAGVSEGCRNAMEQTQRR